MNTTRLTTDSLKDATVQNLGSTLRLDALMRQHHVRLLKVARRFFDCEADASDAVQEAFMKALESISSFREASSALTWLHRIVINVCLSRLRYQRRRPQCSLECLLPRFAADGSHATPQSEWPDGVLERLQTGSRIDACIGALPVDYKAVLILRDVEGYTGREASRALGISIDLVKVRLHRARLALRELMHGCVERELSSEAHGTLHDHARDTDLPVVHRSDR